MSTLPSSSTEERNGLTDGVEGDEELVLKFYELYNTSIVGTCPPPGQLRLRYDASKILVVDPCLYIGLSLVSEDLVFSAWISVRSLVQCCSGGIIAVGVV